MKPLFILTTTLSLLAAAHACDLCGTTLIEHPESLHTRFIFGASEQFTRYKTLQDSGHTIDNDADQKLDSSITQIFLGYRVTPRFVVQLNVPLIRKTFRRGNDEGGLDNGRVQGLGDVSVTGNYLLIDHRSGDFTLRLSANAGVKFPTGDSDHVQEEGAPGHTHGSAPTMDAAEPAADAHAARGVRHSGHAHADPAPAAPMAVTEEVEAPEEHAHLPHGIHGHDISLGTGSVDAIVGGTIEARWKRLFFTAEAQYAIRGDGEHSYDYADDFLWSGGPGVTLIERDTHTLAVQFVCSGETKGEDEYHGARTDDTATTQVFLGPKISGTWRERFSAEVELDIPVLQENSSVQIVPDYRLRAALSWSF